MGLQRVFFTGFQDLYIGDPSCRSPSAMALERPQRPLIHWTALVGIQTFQRLLGCPIVRGGPKNGVMFAQSWHSIPPFARSRGTRCLRQYPPDQCCQFVASKQLSFFSRTPSKKFEFYISKQGLCLFLNDQIRIVREFNHPKEFKLSKNIQLIHGK